MRTRERLAVIAAVMTAANAWGAGPKTILAIGAHAGDMEITAGAVLAKHARAGDRVVLLHLTLGEAGNPKMTTAAYGAQKRREALAAAKALGAEVRFGPWPDAGIPRSDEAASWIAAQIVAIKPTHVITHWKNSIHKDHAVTSALVSDAVLLASLRGWRGLRGLWFADNWEDPEGFQPYVSVDVSCCVEAWKRAVTEYEFIRGGISPFRYLPYYENLLGVRGALAGKAAAESFDIEEFGKKRVLDALP